MAIDNPINKFGYALFNQILKVSFMPQFVLSPVSLWMVLAMTGLGSKNETFKEFCRILNLPEDSWEPAINLINKYHDMFTNSSITLRIANAMGTSFTLSDDYKSKIESSFKAKLFTGSSYTPENINEWINQETKNTISHFLQAPLNPDSALLINSIYFSGKWKFPFDPQLTQQSVFFNATSKVEICSMMYRSGYFNYYEDEHLQAIRVEYDQTHCAQFGFLSGIVILPKKAQFRMELSRYEIIYRDLMSLESLARVDFYLPKFTINYERNYNQDLFDFGLQSAFISVGHSAADFSGMVDSENVRLYISDVVQKAYLNVDESGTEAAVASSERKSHSMPLRMGSFKMQVDHPFLFMVLNDKSLETLFMANINSLSE